MPLFDAFRHKPGPTLYDPFKTAVTADVLEVGFIYAAVIVFFSLIAIIPGVRGRELIYTCIRILFGVFITAGIMLSNFGQEWESAHLHTKTAYRAGTRHEITADIGVKIGLRSVNITLKTNPEKYQLDDNTVENINYNERFDWSGDGWHLGRIGFGPFAGSFNREFRAAQHKGLPYPILWIAEYFTIDGEGIRWGRHYLQAGFYTHICIWLSFPLWLLALITVHLVVRYGAYFMVLTGGALLLGNVLFATIRNTTDLVIPFEDGNLNFMWGSTFYLNLVTGLLAVVIGIILLLMELFYREALASFLGIDVIQDYEEVYATSAEINRLGSRGTAHRHIIKTSSVGKIQMTNRRFSNINGTVSKTAVEEDSQEDIYENPEVIERLFKRKTGWAQRGTIVARIAKSRKTKKRPNPTLNTVDEDPQTIYENTESYGNNGYSRDITTVI